MSISDHAVRIHDADQWHASQLKEIDFLPIPSRHIVTRIGQADKRKLMFIPILSKCVLAIGTDGKNFRAASRELLIFIAQARQLRAAIRSHETAQERQHKRLAAIIGKANKFFIYILKLKLNRRFTRMQQICHSLPTLSLFSKSHRTCSRSICRSTYFAGWDDKNITAKLHLSMDITHREQISISIFPLPFWERVKVREHEYIRRILSKAIRPKTTITFG